MMHFAVVLVVLFRISFGFHLHLGLDHIFHGLTGGKAGLFNFGKFEEPKSIKSDGNEPADKRIFEDSLETIVENTGAILNGSLGKDSLEKVSEKADKAGRIIEDSLKNITKTEVGEKSVSIVEDTLGIFAGKEGKSVNGSIESSLGKISGNSSKAVSGILEGSLEAVPQIAGGSSSGIFEGNNLGSVAGRANKAVNSGILEDSLKNGTKMAGGEEIGSIVEDTLGNSARNEDKSLIGSIGSSVGKIAGNSSTAVSDILEGSFKTVTQIAGGPVSGSLVQGTQGPVAGMASKAVNGVILEDSLKNITKTAVGDESGSIAEDTLGTVAGKEGKSLSGSIGSSVGKIAGNSSTAVNDMLGGSFKTVTQIAGGSSSGSFVENTLEPVAGISSKAVNGGILEDSLKNITKTAGGEESGSIVEDTLGTVAGKEGKSVPGSTGSSLGKIAVNSNKSVSSILESSLKTVTQIANEPVSGSFVENTMGSVAGMASKAESKSSLGDSLANVAENVGGVVPDSNLKNSLNIVAGQSDGTVRGITSEDSVENDSGHEGGAVLGSVVASSLGTVAVNSGKDVSGRVLKYSSEIVPGKTSKAVGSSVLQDSLKTVSRKADEDIEGGISEDIPGGISEDIAGGISEDIAGGISKDIAGGISEDIAGGISKDIEGGISEDVLEIVPGEAGDTLKGSLTSISGAGEGLEGRLKDGIQKVTRAISNKAVNPLQTVTTEVTVEEKCSSKSDVTIFPSVPAVSKFVHIFIQGIHSSELLTILFNITDATPLQFSQFKYRYLADFFRRLGFIDANDIAAFSVRPIAKRLYTLKQQVIERVYANAFANYLFAEGFLTDDNAEQLALAYLKAMEEKAKDNGVSCNCDYNRNFQAMGDGIISFLKSVEGQPSSSQAWEISFYYAHEWLLASVDYGS